MDVPATGGSTADLIVPPKALEQIRRLYAADAEIELAKSDNHIGFRAGGTLVFSRLIEGPYPNYDDIARFEYGRRMWRLPDMRARFLRHWTDERHPYRERFLRQRDLIEEVLGSAESPEELDRRLRERGTSLRCGRQTEHPQRLWPCCHNSTESSLASKDGERRSPAISSAPRQAGRNGGRQTRDC